MVWKGKNGALDNVSSLHPIHLLSLISDSMLYTHSDERISGFSVFKNPLMFDPKSPFPTPPHPLFAFSSLNVFDTPLSAHNGLRQ